MWPKREVIHSFKTLLMKKLSNKFVFYFVIMEENKHDQNKIRQVIHSIVPQAVVESIYDFNEAMIFFKECKTKPHMLFLSEAMSKAGLRINSDGCINNLTLDALPLVFLSDKNTLAHTETITFAKPYDGKHFLSIAAHMNRKWVA